MIGEKVHATASGVTFDAFTFFGDRQHKAKVNGIVVAVRDAKKRGASRANFRVTAKFEIHQSIEPKIKELGLRQLSKGWYLLDQNNNNKQNSVEVSADVVSTPALPSQDASFATLPTGRTPQSAASTLTDVTTPQTTPPTTRRALIEKELNKETTKMTPAEKFSFKASTQVVTEVVAEEAVEASAEATAEVRIEAAMEEAMEVATEATTIVAKRPKPPVSQHCRHGRKWYPMSAAKSSKLPKIPVRQWFVKDIFGDRIYPGTARGKKMTKLAAFLHMFPPAQL